MARDINPNRLSKVGKEDYYDSLSEWLTVSSLPNFIAEKVEEAWKHSYPEVRLTNFGPKEDAREPGISWRIARRVPGLNKMDALKPSLKGVAFDVQTGEVKELHTQHQTVTYEFIVFGLDTDKVNELTDSFENLLFLITPELQKRHVDNFIFEEELREDLVNASRKSEETYKRVLRYNAYIKKKYELSYNMISRIALKTGVEYQEIFDVAVRRASDNTSVDLIEYDIPSTVLSLTRVSDLEIVDLKSGILNAEATGGISARDLFVAEHLYIPNIDYVLYNYVNEHKQLKKAIIWQNNDGAKIPDSGTSYYVSFIKPLVISDTTIQTGV